MKTTQKAPQAFTKQNQDIILGVEMRVKNSQNTVLNRK